IEPPVLLLDEPLSNLDAKLREEMQFELRHIQREVGTTTVMVTHDQTEAMSISDRVVVMEAGRVTQIDRPHRLYEHPQTRFISSFVGKANLLEGRVSATGRPATVKVGAFALKVDAPDAPLGADVSLSLRPEKIRLVAPHTGQLEGSVRERFFLGSQWLYRVATPLGELLVVCSNDGGAPVEEGAAVGLDWSDAMVRVLPGAAVS
ncbi:MAG: ABC transporter ATP-binding protein, partial [Ramlibacter sp.]